MQLKKKQSQFEKQTSVRQVANNKYRESNPNSKSLMQMCLKLEYTAATKDKGKALWFCYYTHRSVQLHTHTVLKVPMNG